MDWFRFPRFLIEDADKMKRRRRRCCRQRRDTTHGDWRLSFYTIHQQYSSFSAATKKTRQRPQKEHKSSSSSTSHREEEIPVLFFGIELSILQQSTLCLPACPPAALYVDWLALIDGGGSLTAIFNFYNQIIITHTWVLNQSGRSV